MTDLGLGKKYDLMRDRNRELNRIAISLRKFPVMCLYCRNTVVGYGPSPDLRGICQDCRTKKEDTFGLCPYTASCSKIDKS